MTQSEALIDEIIPMLVKRELVVSGDINKYRSDIATGKIKAEDWLMLAENATDEEDES